MTDAPEYRTQVRRWFVETGWTDGNGIGLWDQTDESVEVSTKAKAEALRDEWLASGKIERDPWNYLRRVGSYGAFRIRSVWDDTTPEALAASPHVVALLAEARQSGEIAGMMRAAAIVEAASLGYASSVKMHRDAMRARAMGMSAAAENLASTIRTAAEATGKETP